MSQGKAEAEALLAEIVQGSPTVYEKIEGSEGTFRCVAWLLAGAVSKSNSQSQSHTGVRVESSTEISS